MSHEEMKEGVLQVFQFLNINAPAQFSRLVDILVKIILAKWIYFSV